MCESKGNGADGFVWGFVCFQFQDDSGQVLLSWIENEDAGHVGERHVKIQIKYFDWVVFIGRMTYTIAKGYDKEDGR